jgi:uncharacterized membrane protein YqiK
LSACADQPCLHRQRDTVVVRERRQHPVELAGEPGQAIWAQRGDRARQGELATTWRKNACAEGNRTRRLAIRIRTAAKDVPPSSRRSCSRPGPENGARIIAAASAST